MDHVIGLDPVAEARDRIFVAPGLDLRLVAIELGIEHRMGAEAIGAAFEEIGLAGLAHLLTARRAAASTATTSMPSTASELSR